MLLSLLLLLLCLLVCLLLLFWLKRMNAEFRKLDCESRTKCKKNRITA